MTLRRWSRIALGVAAGLLLVCVAATAFFAAAPARTPERLATLVEDWTGGNAHPVTLLRPPVQPLSALARIGEQIFFDRSLSASGRQSCASCHDPAHGYGPPNALPVQPGGVLMTERTFRPPPSLAYLYRQAVFSIGPPGDDDNPVTLAQAAQQAQANTRADKSAANPQPAAAAPVPQGGLFWDGRADTLMAQAAGPMMDRAEMANDDLHAVVRRIALAKYAGEFKPLFGEAIVRNPDLLFAEAMSAVARYQVEAQSFHRFDSRYDLWLEGKARLSRAEMRGMRLFNDPAKGNCAACHLSRPGLDGTPPLFTDTEYEALGVPRNPALPANQRAGFFDLGLCGPIRTDLRRQTAYCGMFLTPTLRNAAKRSVFFHNGVYHTLRQVLDFYNLRDTNPERIYPRDARGNVVQFDDLPQKYRANIDVADAPFGRKRGSRPALSDPEVADVIAFIGTLNDGDRGGRY